MADYVEIFLKTKPGSYANKIERDAEGNWLVRIKAPAMEGKANTALISYLSEKLNVPKSSIQILSGASSRFKRLRIHGIQPAEAESRLLFPE